MAIGSSVSIVATSGCSFAVQDRRDSPLVRAGASLESVELLGNDLFADAQADAADQHVTSRRNGAELVTSLSAETASLAVVVRRDGYHSRHCSLGGLAGRDDIAGEADTAFADED